jgi:hypothetical protein
MVPVVEKFPFSGAPPCSPGSDSCEAWSGDFVLTVVDILGISCAYRYVFPTPPCFGPNGPEGWSARSQITFTSRGADWNSFQLQLTHEANHISGQRETTEYWFYGTLNPAQSYPYDCLAHLELDMFCHNTEVFRTIFTPGCMIREDNIFGQPPPPPPAIHVRALD